MSTLTETAIADGIVWVGPGTIDPPGVVVGMAVVTTSVVGIVVGTVVTGGCGEGPEQPVVKSIKMRTREVRHTALIFIDKSSRSQVYENSGE